MDDDQFIFEDIEQTTEQELKMKEGAQKMFIMEGNPLPVRKQVTFGNILTMFGLEVVLRIASTIGAAMVSATAVGAVMEITMIKLNQVFNASTDAVLTRGIFFWSILAFEIGLMASGMTAGRKNSNMKDARWATWAGFATTITAGLLRSMTLIENDTVEFGLALIFGAVVAFAGPIISYYGSENFGFILKEIQGLQDTFNKQWEKDMSEWGTKFRKEYSRIAKQVYGEDRRLTAKFDDESPKPKSERKNVRAEVKDFLVQQAIYPSQVGPEITGNVIITPAQIADALQLVGPSRDAVRKYVSQFRTEQDQGKW